MENQTVINLRPVPFGITFTWKEKEIRITLKDGEDVLKLAREFANFLDQTKIEYEIKMTNVEYI
jgi:hypothetical protein